jgi:enterochelin esterase-like enzyme
MRMGHFSFELLGRSERAILNTALEPMTLSNTAETAPTPTLGDNFTEVLRDRRVTFRLLAPKANAVSVLVGLKSGVYEAQGTTTTARTKGADGLWAVTLGPFEPNLYEYQFNLDGALVPDPGNDRPKPKRHVDTSLLLIPGDPPNFLDVQNGAHGTTREETYYSTALGRNRRLLVYTPPTYDRSRAPLPVLYLYHGTFDTLYAWVTEGRLPQIMDNLLTQGKAVPMVVVVPEAHALTLEPTPAPSGDLVTNLTPYLVSNQRAVDEELFHDIIPFIQTRYNISEESQERAIAGLSMGGRQSIETGIMHLGYFDWIGAFSPAVFVFSAEFQEALKDAEGINKSLRLFDIVTGDNDALVGKANTEFDAELTRLNIRHGYTVVPGTHSMFVWRPALAKFLQQIFRR